MKQGDKRRALKHCDPDKSTTVCVRACVHPLLPEELRCNFMNTVCSISFERLVRSGDDFLSAAAFYYKPAASEEPLL